MSRSSTSTTFDAIYSSKQEELFTIEQEGGQLDTFELVYPHLGEDWDSNLDTVLKNPYNINSLLRAIIKLALRFDFSTSKGHGDAIPRDEAMLRVLAHCPKKLREAFANGAKAGTLCNRLSRAINAVTREKLIKHLAGIAGFDDLETGDNRELDGFVFEFTSAEDSKSGQFGIGKFHTRLFSDTKQGMMLKYVVKHGAPANVSLPDNNFNSDIDLRLLLRTIGQIRPENQRGGQYSLTGLVQENNSERRMLNRDAVQADRIHQHLEDVLSEEREQGAQIVVAEIVEKDQCVLIFTPVLGRLTGLDIQFDSERESVKLFLHLMYPEDHPRYHEEGFDTDCLIHLGGWNLNFVKLSRAVTQWRMNDDLFEHTELDVARDLPAKYGTGLGLRTQVTLSYEPGFLVLKVPSTKQQALQQGGGRPKWRKKRARRPSLAPDAHDVDPLVHQDAVHQAVALVHSDRMRMQSNIVIPSQQWRTLNGAQNVTNLVRTISGLTFGQAVQEMSKRRKEDDNSSVEVLPGLACHAQDFVFFEELLTLVDDQANSNSPSNMEDPTGTGGTLPQSYRD